MATTSFVSCLLLAALAATPLQQAGGRSNPAALVPAEKLMTLLPRVPGWDRGEPDGETMAAPIAQSVARVSYDRGDSSVSLEIIDAALNRMLVTPFAMLMRTGYSEKTPGGGYTRAAAIAGFPGVEVWDPENGPTADVTVLVADRFLVKASATGVTDTAVTRKVVEAVDLKALAALK